MPAAGRLIGTPASISASEEPHTVAIEDEPFELGDLGDQTDGVGKFLRLRQQRMNRAPGKLAVAYFTPLGAAHAAGLADRIRREIIVQQEGFLVTALQGVDPLLVLAGAERGHHQRLGFAAGEQRRSMGARQQADFGHDVTHGLEIAAVDALAGVQNVPAHDLGFQFLEHAADAQLGVGRIVHAAGEIVFQYLGLDCGDGILPFLFGRDGIGGAQFLLGDAENFLFQRLVVGDLMIARLLRRLFRELDNGVDHWLEMPVAEHHRAQHDFFAELLGFRLHHQHRVGGAGHDQIELALGHLVELRIKHVFVVDEANARGADRAHEGRAGQRKRRRGRNQCQDVGIVFQIVR